MKKVTLNILCLFIIITICSFSNKKVVVYGKSEKAITTVTNIISFSVMDSQGHPISDAKLVIISMNGDVLGVETSNTSGHAQKKLTVPIDNRYNWIDPNKIESRGTVTTIAFKEGYREQVIFEVPLSPAGSSQEIYLISIIAGQRNEPDVQLGNSHHLETLSLVDKYYKYIKR